MMAKKVSINVIDTTDTTSDTDDTSETVSICDPVSNEPVSTPVTSFREKYYDTPEYSKNLGKVQSAFKLVRTPSHYPMDIRIGKRQYTKPHSINTHQTGHSLPKLCYASNSNMSQSRVINQFNNKMFVTSPEKISRQKKETTVIIKTSPHVRSLSSLYSYMDVAKIKRIVRAVIDILEKDFHTILPIDINNPVYITASYSKNVITCPMDIQLVNSNFCTKIVNKDQLNTLIFYTCNKKSYVIFHEKTRIMINKMYSSYKISVFSYDKSLCQESLNENNTIVYKPNGVIISNASGVTKLILPSTAMIKNQSHIMDCFMVWRF